MTLRPPPFSRRTCWLPRVTTGERLSHWTAATNFVCRTWLRPRSLRGGLRIEPRLCPHYVHSYGRRKGHGPRFVLVKSIQTFLLSRFGPAPACCASSGPLGLGVACLRSAAASKFLKTDRQDVSAFRTLVTAPVAAGPPTPDELVPHHRARLIDCETSERCDRTQLPRGCINRALASGGFAGPGRVRLAGFPSLDSSSCAAYH